MKAAAVAAAAVAEVAEAMRSVWPLDKIRNNEEGGRLVRRCLRGQTLVCRIDDEASSLLSCCLRRRGWFIVWTTRRRLSSVAVRGARRWFAK